MSYVCRICDLRVQEIPKDAVLVVPSGRGRKSSLYRFADGSIHDLRLKHNAEPPVAQPDPTPPPVEQPELLQEVVGILEQLPEPQQELPIEQLPQQEAIAEPEIDDDETSAPITSTMRMAFQRFKRDSR
jgi:hypothetical protein